MQAVHQVQSPLKHHRRLKRQFHFSFSGEQEAEKTRTHRRGCFRTEQNEQSSGRWKNVVLPTSETIECRRNHKRRSVPQPMRYLPAKPRRDTPRGCRQERQTLNAFHAGTRR